MATLEQHKRILKEKGWVQLEDIPMGLLERLDLQSADQKERKKESVIRYVSCWYEAFQKGSQFMVVTDGAEFVTVNAEAMLVVSPNAAAGWEHTTFFTIGASDDAVYAWLAWVAEGRDPEKRPDRGFNYVS